MSSVLAMVPNSSECDKCVLMDVSFIVLSCIYMTLVSSSFHAQAQSFLVHYKPLFLPAKQEELLELARINDKDVIKQINDVVTDLNTSKATLLAIQTKLPQLRSALSTLKSLGDPSTGGTATGGTATGGTDHSNSEFTKARDNKVNALLIQIKEYTDTHNTTIASMNKTISECSSYPYLMKLKTSKVYVHISNSCYANLCCCLRSEGCDYVKGIVFGKMCWTVCGGREENRVLWECDYDGVCGVGGSGVSENVGSGVNGSGGSGGSKRKLNDVYWGTPFPPSLRQLLNTHSNTASSSNNNNNNNIPFPDFVDNSYNTSLLMSGFRKLAALEREIYTSSSHDNSSESIVKYINKTASGVDGYNQKGAAFRPSICSVVVGGGVTISPYTNASASGVDSVGISCMKLSPLDSGLVATGLGNGVINIFHNNAGSNKYPSELIGHKSNMPVYDIAWFRDQRTIVSGGGDGCIRLWDCCVSGVNGSNGHSSRGGGKGGKGEEGGKGTQKGTPKGTPQGTCLAEYYGHVGVTPVYSVDVADSGYYFASGGQDSVVRLWSTDRSSPARMFVGHVNDVNTVKFHPNVNYIASGGNDRNCRLWDIQSGNCVRLFNGVAGGVSCIAFCPSGKNVAVGDDKGFVYVYDIGTGKKIYDCKCKSGEERGNTHVYSIQYSQDGSCVASGCNGYINLYDVRGNNEFEKRAPVRSFSTSDIPVMDLVWTKANVILAGGVV
jgi:WD40 repeat protein